jgi:FtsH-binding integral membrane protein
MAIIGYFTKTDLTKIGNILMMILIGIVLASIVNLFLQSDSFTYFISFVSVVVFAGLTAFDIQKIKKLAEETQIDEGMKKKLGIIGALTLYLDFINLFLSLLHLLGNRKKT